MNAVSHHRQPSELEALEAELDEATAWAHRLVAQAYLPLIRDAVARARERGLTGDGPFRRDFFGWLLGRMIEPPVRGLV